MKFKLEIELDNEDFARPRTNYAVARLLHEVASKLRQLEDGLRLGSEGKIRDVNGNTCGKWKVVPFGELGGGE